MKAQLWKTNRQQSSYLLCFRINSQMYINIGWDIKHFPISYNTATMYKRSDDKCAHI